jgi:cbb3-type cytochrome c oxidase subunit III
MAGGIRGLLAAALVLSWSATALAANSEQSHGAEIYSTFCASCHGRYGRGDGPLASSLTRAPRDFTDSAWLAGRSDEQIVDSLTDASHGPMAIASVLRKNDLRAAIAYIRTLSVPGEHVSVVEGHDIYNAVCWVCHGRDGKGDGPAAKNLVGPKPRDFTSPKFVIAGREEEIARTISMGAEASFHGSHFMPAWGHNLSDEQIRSLIAYLKTLKK